MLDLKSDLIEEYASNLRDYLGGGGEAVLKRSYELARMAMNKGVGVLELAMLHHEAMALVLKGMPDSENVVRAIKSSEIVFAESLSPFEMAHRAFRESNQALRRLNEQLEAEAKRVAHALHDEASQLLVSVHLALAKARNELPPHQRRHLAGIEGLLDEVNHQIRRLSHEIRPTILDDLGLLPALRFLAEGVRARASIPVIVTGELTARLAPAVETTIYRAVKEALNNMAKHSKATSATIQILEGTGRITCSVRDDGRGFDAAAAFGGGMGCMGLVGIRERLNAVGGTLQISSSPGHGADLIFTIPTEG